MAESADESRSSVAEESGQSTGTVAALPQPAVAPTEDSQAQVARPGPDREGFGPLEDPPRLEGVPLIGDPDNAVDEVGEANAVEGVDEGASALIDENDSEPLIDPALLVISPDLAARAGEISRETARIDQEVEDIEQSQGLNETDTVAPAEEESV